MTRALLALLAAWSLQAHALPADDDFLVLGQADRILVTQGDAVTLTAVSNAPSGANVQFEWHANAGSIAPPSGGADATWLTQGLEPGRYALEVQGHDANGHASSATLTVVVAAAARGAGQTSAYLARASLDRAHQEIKDYGLYSYLILSRAGCADKGRARCVQFVSTALLGIGTEADLKQSGIAAKELNITYLLTAEVDPSADEDTPAGDAVTQHAQWLVEHYDYARAQHLLHLVGVQATGSGPFVISTLHPVFLENGLGVDKHMLFQDYSLAPENILPLWLKRFSNQSLQPQFWSAARLQSLAWDIRQYLAIAGLGLPVTKAAIKDVLGK